MAETKKFELTSDFVINAFGKKLFRIKALISFAGVKAGEMGGYVEKEKNLEKWKTSNPKLLPCKSFFTPTERFLFA